MPLKRTVRRISGALNEPLALARREHWRRFESTIVGLVTVGAVGAFSLGPVQRFASYSGMLAGSLFIVTGLLTPLLIPRKRATVALLGAAFAMILLGGTILYFVAFDALKKADWNDRRCLKLQTAMLRPGPRARKDLAEIFTALGCRPQGKAPTDPNYTFSPARAPTMADLARHDAFENAALSNEVETDATSIK